MFVYRIFLHTYAVIGVPEKSKQSNVLKWSEFISKYLLDASDIYEILPISVKCVVADHNRCT